MSGAAAAFVDRDGVINALITDPVTGVPESPLRVEDVTLLPGASGALHRLSLAGLLLVGVSNQPAAAKGLVTTKELWAVQARVIELLAAEGIRFDDFRLCLHHPDGVVSELTGVCDCRKPAPGMLFDGAQNLGIDITRSWMVGDTDADVIAGQAAGTRTVLVRHPPSAHKRGGPVRPDVVADDLAHAAELILPAEGVH